MNRTLDCSTDSCKPGAAGRLSNMPNSSRYLFDADLLVSVASGITGTFQCFCFSIRLSL
jgi:hypothetical protein